MKLNFHRAGQFPAFVTRLNDENRTESPNSTDSRLEDSVPYVPILRLPPTVNRTCTINNLQLYYHAIGILPMSLLDRRANLPAIKKALRPHPLLIFFAFQTGVGLHLNTGKVFLKIQTWEDLRANALKTGFFLMSKKCHLTLHYIYFT